MSALLHILHTAAAAASYAGAILALNPLALWLLAETSGSAADNATGDAGYDGGYSACTLNNTTGPDGVLGAPLFNGASSYISIGTAALQAGFSATAGALLVWGKVAASGVWSDGANRNLIELAADNSNRVLIQKSSSASTLAYYYTAGGTLESVNAACSATGWFSAALTWDTAAGGSGEVKAYLNGAQAGATQTGLGARSGTLDAARCTIGSRNTTPLNPWSGWLAACALFDRALSGAVIAALAAP